ncbi:MAG: hypothetical protein ABIP03_10010 [Aquihabitans sp.]
MFAMPAPGRQVTVALVVTALATALAGCAPVDGPSPSTAGVEIPQSALTPLDKCLLGKGFQIVHRADPRPSPLAASSVKEWETDLSPEAAAAAGKECRDRYAPFVAKTEAEIRAIYKRWVEERACLELLGYNVAEPPTLEKFVSDWQTGPWMPIDGIDMASWTDREFQTARDACGLEMVDR